MCKPCLWHASGCPYPDIHGNTTGISAMAFSPFYWELKAPQGPPADQRRTPRRCTMHAATPYCGAEAEAGAEAGGELGMH